MGAKDELWLQRLQAVAQHAASPKSGGATKSGSGRGRSSRAGSRAAAAARPGRAAAAWEQRAQDDGRRTFHVRQSPRVQLGATVVGERCQHAEREQRRPVPVTTPMVRRKKAQPASARRPTPPAKPLVIPQPDGVVGRPYTPTSHRRSPALTGASGGSSRKSPAGLPWNSPRASPRPPSAPSPTTRSSCPPSPSAGRAAAAILSAAPAPSAAARESPVGRAPTSESYASRDTSPLRPMYPSPEPILHAGTATHVQAWTRPNLADGTARPIEPASPRPDREPPPTPQQALDNLRRMLGLGEEASPRAAWGGRKPCGRPALLMPTWARLDERVRLMQRHNTETSQLFADIAASEAHPREQPPTPAKQIADLFDPLGVQPPTASAPAEGTYRTPAHTFTPPPKAAMPPSDWPAEGQLSLGLAMATAWGQHDQSRPHAEAAPCEDRESKAEGREARFCVDLIPGEDWERLLYN